MDGKADLVSARCQGEKKRSCKHFLMDVEEPESDVEEYGNKRPHKVDFGACSCQIVCALQLS